MGVIRARQVKSPLLAHSPPSSPRTLDEYDVEQMSPPSPIIHAIERAGLSKRGLAMPTDDSAHKTNSSNSPRNLWELLDVTRLLESFEIASTLLDDANKDSKEPLGLLAFYKSLLAVLDVARGLSIDPKDSLTKSFLEIYFGDLKQWNSLDSAPSDKVAKVLLGAFRLDFHRARQIVIEAAEMDAGPIRDALSKAAMQFCWTVTLHMAIRKRVAADGALLVTTIKYAARHCHKWSNRAEDRESFHDVIFFLWHCVSMGNRALSARYDDIFLDFEKLQLALHAFDAKFGPQIDEDYGAILRDTCSLVFCSIVTLRVVRSHPELNELKESRTRAQRERLKARVDPAEKYHYPDSCNVCSKPASELCELKRCSKCRVARYCSIECQTRDWKTGNHKERCFKA